MNGVLVLAKQKLSDGIQPYWSEWRLRVHSTALMNLYTGKPALFYGGLDGRIYRYGGRFRTDSGIFIPARMDSRPESVAGPGGSSRPNYCYWWVHGDRSDHVQVRVRKDMDIQQETENRPQQIRCNDAPVDSLKNPIPDFGVGAFTPGEGTEYGLPDARVEVERQTRLGTSFRQIQFSVSQELDEMPVGSRREAGFDIAGYVLTADKLGRKTAR